MALKAIEIEGQRILVEVTQLAIEQEGEGSHDDRGWEYTARSGTGTGTGAGDGQDMGKRISGLVGVLTAPVRRSLAAAGAAEWTMEISLGFKGETGVPFVAKGESNAAVKVTAKWAKPEPAERTWLKRATRR